MIPPARCFMFIISFHSPCETSITAIPQAKRMRLREAECLAQGHHLEKGSIWVQTQARVISKWHQLCSVKASSIWSEALPSLCPSVTLRPKHRTFSKQGTLDLPCLAEERQGWLCSMYVKCVCVCSFWEECVVLIRF